MTHAPRPPCNSICTKSFRRLIVTTHENILKNKETLRHLENDAIVCEREKIEARHLREMRQLQEAEDMIRGNIESKRLMRGLRVHATLLERWIKVEKAAREVIIKEETGKWDEVSTSWENGYETVCLLECEMRGRLVIAVGREQNTPQLSFTGIPLWYAGRVVFRFLKHLVVLRCAREALLNKRQCVLLCREADIRDETMREFESFMIHTLSNAESEHRLIVRNVYVTNVEGVLHEATEDLHRSSIRSEEVFLRATIRLVVLYSQEQHERELLENTQLGWLHGRHTMLHFLKDKWVLKDCELYEGIQRGLLASYASRGTDSLKSQENNEVKLCAGKSINRMVKSVLSRRKRHNVTWATHLYNVSRSYLEQVQHTYYSDDIFCQYQLFLIEQETIARQQLLASFFRPSLLALQHVEASMRSSFVSSLRLLFDRNAVVASEMHLRDDLMREERYTASAFYEKRMLLDVNTDEATHRASLVESEAVAACELCARGEKYAETHAQFMTVVRQCSAEETVARAALVREGRDLCTAMQYRGHIICLVGNEEMQRERLRCMEIVVNNVLCETSETLLRTQWVAVEQAQREVCVAKCTEGIVDIFQKNVEDFTRQKSFLFAEFVNLKEDAVAMWRTVVVSSSLDCMECSGRQHIIASCQEGTWQLEQKFVRELLLKKQQYIFRVDVVEREDAGRASIVSAKDTAADVIYEAEVASIASTVGASEHNARLAIERTEDMKREYLERQCAMWHTVCRCIADEVASRDNERAKLNSMQSEANRAAAGVVHIQWNLRREEAMQRLLLNNHWTEDFNLLLLEREESFERCLLESFAAHVFSSVVQNIDEFHASQVHLNRLVVPAYRKFAYRRSREFILSSSKQKDLALDFLQTLRKEREFRCEQREQKELLEHSATIVQRTFHARYNV